MRSDVPRIKRYVARGDISRNSKTVYDNRPCWNRLDVNEDVWGLMFDLAPFEFPAGESVIQLDSDSKVEKGDIWRFSCGSENM